MGSVKIVSASAGSGKTYNLAYEYVRNVIREPELYRHILAVTFTNKATEEMKQRILSSINDLAHGRESEFLSGLQRDLNFSPAVIERRAARVRSNILHDYSRFSVLTIDKFFQRIIRSFIREMGIETDFSLELPVDTLLSKAADKMIDSLSSDAKLREWVTAFVNERIEENQKWDLRGDIMQLGRETFTEAYKQGLAHSRSKEELAEIVRKRIREAETIKKEAAGVAGTLLGLLAENSLSASDFSYGERGAIGFVAKMAAGKFPEPSSYVRKALDEDKWYTAKTDAGTKVRIDALLPQLHEYVGRLYALYYSGVRKINSAELLRENYRNFALLTDLRQKIAEVAQEDNILHISEINVLLSNLIANNDTPFIFEKTGNQFSHFMIDEFQDTSSMQWQNFIPLLKNAVAQSADTPVMLVGDIKQSIYRWRGGDWTILAKKASQEFSDTVSMSLQDNFRSKRTIVEFNNELIGAVTAMDNDRLDAALDEALAAGDISREFAAEMRNSVSNAYSDYLQNPKDSNTGGYVTVDIYNPDAYEGGGGDDDPVADEAANAPHPVIAVVEEAQQRGYRASDIAILVRRRNEGAQIAQLLLQYKRENANKPYVYDIITQDALILGNAPAANFITACFKLSSNPSDAISRTIYNRYLGRALDAEIPPADAKLFDTVKIKSLEDAFEAIVIHFRLGKKHDEAAFLQAYHEQVIRYSTAQIADIPLFVEWWEDKGYRESVTMPSDMNAITIDTIHRSKGLGHKVVIIPYANWKMTPGSSGFQKTIMWTRPSGDDAEIGSFPVVYKKIAGRSVFAEDYYREYVMSHIDNLNLLYVALTRAKEELHIMSPEPKRADSERIDYLIERSLQTDGGGARFSGMTHVYNDENTGRKMEFGTPTVQPPQAQERPQAEYIGFDSAPIGERMAIRLRSQRYFEEGAADDRLAPRDYGIMMHRIFEQAVSAEDIEADIEASRSDGVLSEEEERSLRGNISAAFEDERVAGWFDGSWDVVRNENSILVPGNAQGYRPDRVMQRGDSAVVVDYKFGLAENPRYAGQIQRYKSLLAEMGCTSVTGYIWYVSLGRVIEIP